MANLTRYSGSKTALVQFRISGRQTLPPVIRERTVDPAAPRKGPARQEEILRLNGVTGAHLRKVLEESGLLLVDAYFEHRESASSGKMSTLVTFLWGRESNHLREAELIDQALPVMAKLLVTRWGEVVVRELTAHDGSHTFNTIVFGSPILDPKQQIAEDDLAKEEYEPFGLTQTWSMRKSRKRREDHVAA